MVLHSLQPTKTVYPLPLASMADAVLSILDKPLSLLGKVNGILKPEDKREVGGVEACRGCERDNGGAEHTVET